MQRRSDTAAQTQTAPATAAGNFRLESIPALLEVGVQAEHWSAAQQLARRRVLSRLLQALSRWYTLAEPQRGQVKAELEALKPQVKSKNVSETLNSMLNV